jgi:hypothetical protein
MELISVNKGPDFRDGSFFRTRVAEVGRPVLGDLRLLDDLRANRLSSRNRRRMAATELDGDAR